MKLAFPELTRLEPPSRGKLINELRHGGPVYEKPVSRPRSCRHAPRTPVGKRCSTAREQSAKLGLNFRMHQLAGNSDRLINAASPGQACHSPPGKREPRARPSAW